MGVLKEETHKNQTEKEKRRKKQKKVKKYVDIGKEVWYIKVAVCKKKANSK